VGSLPGYRFPLLYLTHGFKREIQAAQCLLAQFSHHLKDGVTGLLLDFFMVPEGQDIHDSLDVAEHALDFAPEVIRVIGFG
jgi:hypothetical protein